MKKLSIILLCLTLLVTMLLTIVLPDQEVSFGERRVLKDFPILSLDSLLSGKFMGQLEDYLLDQFAYRDYFRSIKALVEFDVFHKKDVNGIYVGGDHLFKMDYPYQEDMVDRMVVYMKSIQEKYLKNNQVYFSIIPDKSYYYQGDILKIDHQKLMETLCLGLSDMNYIDLYSHLSLDDYYYTDPHWRQEKLEEVILALSEGMDFTMSPLEDYQPVVYPTFYGAYYGQSALAREPENLVYLTVDDFAVIKVTNYEKLDEELSVYDVNELEGIDAYNVFLSGASPLITLENPLVDNERELIIFRDSFASSLTPLLLSSYSSITLVDTRYMSYQLLDQFITFNHQDVLFLYSSMVINNSIMLK